MSLILLLSISFSACKKDEVKEIEPTPKKLKIDGVVSTAYPSSSGLNQNAWDNYIAYAYSPEELDENDHSTATDMTKNYTWLVAEQAIGLWSVYSTESIKITNRGKMPRGYRFKIVGITHRGSVMDTKPLVPTTWDEAYHVPNSWDTHASMYVVGNVRFFGTSRVANGFKVWTAPQPIVNE